MTRPNSSKTIVLPPCETQLFGPWFESHRLAYVELLHLIVMPYHRHITLLFERLQQ